MRWFSCQTSPHRRWQSLVLFLPLPPLIATENSTMDASIRYRVPPVRVKAQYCMFAVELTLCTRLIAA